jgi:mono/diheme cytochrome c family protein
MIRVLIRRWNWTFAFVAGCALVGCGKTDPPPFRLDMTNVVSKQIPAEQRQRIADTLQAMFGTPDEPFAMPDSGLDGRKLRMAAGPVWGDEEGGKRGIYRRHCAHCHGVTGDGKGPTAGILNPYPRDYRLGLFKFKSTARAARPTDEDLRRIIHNGIPATAMPSFALLPPDEVAALVEYVKYLSMRGQMELALEEFAFSEDLGDPTGNAELQTAINEMLTGIVDEWKSAPDNIVRPDESLVPPMDRTPAEVTASIDAGRALFYGAKANCFSCHGPTGLGDGQQTDFDDWTKRQNNFVKDLRSLPDTIQATRQRMEKETGEDRQLSQQRLEEDARKLAEMEAIEKHLLEPRNAIPRNLREGVYRGGGRPIDIFWRISTGISGTPMPAAPATLTQQEIWQIVDYVHSLPFEPASRPPHAQAAELGAVSR